MMAVDYDDIKKRMALPISNVQSKISGKSMDAVTGVKTKEDPETAGIIQNWPINKQTGQPFDVVTTSSGTELKYADYAEQINQQKMSMPRGSNEPAKASIQQGITSMQSQPQQQPDQAAEMQSTPDPDAFGGEAVNAAGAMSSFYMSPAGEFASGFMNVGQGISDPTQPTLVTMGSLAGFASTLSAVNGLAAGLNSLVTSTAATGKSGIQTSLKAYDSATGFASNAKTVSFTQSWLQKLFTQAKLIRTVPVTTGVAGETATIVSTTSEVSIKSVVTAAGLAGGIVAAIGSYPFAGFIKEEALQAVGYASSSAIREGDVQGAREAINFQKQLLNPTVWKRIMESIPFVNTINALTDFYQAAAIDAKIKETMFDNMLQDMDQSQQDPDSVGDDALSESDKHWQRIREQQSQQEKDLIDYYNDERKKLVEWEREAEKAARKEEAAYWRKQQEIMSEREKKDQQAIIEYWLAYRKQLQKMYEDASPSNLNFGLL